eukprot:GGOE01027032.1.p1 GENE.GGOE01027032.1~~GGOE01027032.1.p1  ORF type:complete len:547 (+),score=62.00 GGOE01027032.1:84-1643(+)
MAACMLLRGDPPAGPEPGPRADSAPEMSREAGEGCPGPPLAPGADDGVIERIAECRVQLIAQQNDFCNDVMRGECPAFEQHVHRCRTVSTLEESEASNADFHEKALGVLERRSVPPNVVLSEAQVRELLTAKLIAAANDERDLTRKFAADDGQDQVEEHKVEIVKGRRCDQLRIILARYELHRQRIQQAIATAEHHADEIAHRPITGASLLERLQVNEEAERLYVQGIEWDHRAVVLAVALEDVTVSFNLYEAVRLERQGRRALQLSEMVQRRAVQQEAPLTPLNSAPQHPKVSPRPVSPAYMQRALIPPAFPIEDADSTASLRWATPVHISPNAPTSPPPHNEPDVFTSTVSPGALVQSSPSPAPSSMLPRPSTPNLMPHPTDIVHSFQPQTILSSPSHTLLPGARRRPSPSHAAAAVHSPPSPSPPSARLQAAPCESPRLMGTFVTEVVDRYMDAEGHIFEVVRKPNALPSPHTEGAAPLTSSSAATPIPALLSVPLYQAPASAVPVFPPSPRFGVP